MRLKSFSNIITLLLALFGCIVAIVLTYEEYHPAADIGCSRFGGDCSKTINSKYGHLGPIPTSLLGLGMYLTVAGLCVARHKLLRARRTAETSRASSYTNALDDEIENDDVPGTFAPSVDPALEIRRKIKQLDFGLWGIATLAVGASWLLQYVALYKICSFCPWCFASAALVTLMFLLTSYDFLIEGRKLDGEQKLLAGVSAFIIVCFGGALASVVVARIGVCSHGALPSDVPPSTVVEPSKHDLLVVKYLKFRGPNPKAKYMLIEFADYECPHCKKAAKRVEELLKTPPKGGIRFAFRNFPLDQIHQQARPAAMAAEAASEQGKFWEMHDIIFAHQDELGKPGFLPENFDEWAEQVGLNVDKFKRDSESTKIAERVANDHVAGDLTGLKITPSFYLITPTQITLLSGLDELEKVWKDPGDARWK
jgi:protein-disulfide isomerase/uncharacterized membrane protein